jgi:PAS domain S-box-containing protein
LKALPVNPPPFNSEWYRYIVETTSEGILVVDSQFQIIFANHNMSKMLGYSMEEFMGKRVFQFIDRIHHLLLWTAISRNRHGLQEQLEIKLLCRDGADFWAILNLTPFHNSEGIYTGALGMVTDISRQKMAESVLRRYQEHLEDLVEERTQKINRANQELHQEIIRRQQVEAHLEAERQRLFSVLDELPALVYLISPDYSIRFGNRLFHERFGPVNGNPCYSVFHRRTSPCPSCSTFKEGHGLEYARQEYSYPDGHTYEMYDYPFTDIDGVEMLLSFGLDITEKKRSETALRQSEAKFSKAFHGNPDAITITTLKDGRYIEVNDACSIISGYKREDIIGHTVEEIELYVTPGDRELLLQEIAARGRVVNRETKYKMKNGEIKYFLLSAELLQLDGEPHLLCVAHDITMRKCMEEALLLSEERFSKAFHASPINMAITAFKDGRIIDANDSLCRLLGYSHDELLNKTSTAIGFWADLADRTRVQNMMDQQGIIRGMELNFMLKNGEQRLALYSADKICLNGESCILSIIEDITDRRKMETEIKRLERLYLVGEMAAGLGHEIRNPMTAVRGFLQLFGEKYRDDQQDQEYLNLMIEELDRANSIINEFLSLARSKIIELKGANLKTIIKSIIPIIQASATMEDKYVMTDLQDVPNLLLDEKEIRQLIHNLVRNGLDSMAPGGTIIVGTCSENDRVVLYIKDQGCGIAAQFLDRIGTPFFTTKEQGTGLGLAVCYNIAERHKARIDFNTGVGGTTFYVRFPTE